LILSDIALLIVHLLACFVIAALCYYRVGWIVLLEIGQARLAFFFPSPVP